MKGSHAPSRQERQDTSRPSATDTAPPHMVAEMQMMKEMMDFMMNALKGWVSNNLDELVHWTDSPFTTLITSFPFPTKFCMLQIEAYNRSKDPLDHLELGVSKDPHQPTRPPETARTKGPRTAPNPPTVGHGLARKQPE